MTTDLESRLRACAHFHDLTYSEDSIEEACALLREAADALAAQGWRPISEIESCGQSVLLYSDILAKDAEFPGHPYLVSNSRWAKAYAQTNGYALWQPLTPPAALAAEGETNG